MKLPMKPNFYLALFLALNNGHQCAMALSSPNPAKGQALKPFGGGGGGRKSLSPDMPNLRNMDEPEEDQNTKPRWEPTPPKPSEARLTVVQITDVYTLEHFASLKTMLKETRAKIQSFRAKLRGDINGEKTNGEKEELAQTLTKSETGVISMLTGDFLAPYLLSSVDRGKGMMNALAKTPIDYLTWGTFSCSFLLGPAFHTCRLICAAFQAIMRLTSTIDLFVLMFANFPESGSIPIC
jgi:hypothetical protein